MAYYFIILSERNRTGGFREKKFVLKSTNPLKAEEYLLNEYIPKINDKLDWTIQDIRKI